MTTKESYTKEEWILLKQIPSLVGVGMMVADPSGIVGGIKEAIASAKGTIDGIKLFSDVELIQSILTDKDFSNPVNPKEILGEGTKEEQIENLKQDIINKYAAVNELLKTKSTPEEAEAYKKWLIHIADKVAKASKEKSGDLVSEAEVTYLQTIATTLETVLSNS